MSNTFNGMNFTNIAQRGLTVFSKRLLGMGIFTRDFSLDVANQGTIVQTRIVPASSAPVEKSTLAYNDATIITGETTTAVPVTLNKHYVDGFELTDKEMDEIGAGVMQDTKDKIIEKKVNALADQMLTYVFGLIKATSYSNAMDAVDPAACDNDDVIDWRTTLAKAHFPIMDTNLVLNPDYIGALLKDAKISQMYSSGLSAIVDGAGAVARLGGMSVYEAVTLPTNSENLGGFACTPDCLAVAMRPIRQHSAVPTEYQEVLTDPQTGAVLNYYGWRDSAYRRWIHNFEILYGASVANSDALYRIKTA